MESSQSRVRRWWIVGGGVLLGGLVLVAVFSLGVTLGRQGWGAGAPQPGPGGRPPDRQWPAGPGGAVGEPQGPPAVERPVLRGRIRSWVPGGFTLETAQGTRFVEVTAETRYTRMTGQGEVEIGAEALRVGQVVDIFGRPDPDGRMLIAERVVLLPSPAP